MSLALIPTCAWSQTQLVTLSGTITDPSGAVVPGVSVTIVRQGTGLKRSTLTNTVGEYRFAGLPTGDYLLRVEKTGFQSQIRQGVELNSVSKAMINSQLAIGEISQQMTVNANAAVIDNSTSTINGLLPEHSLTELPLNNRDLCKYPPAEPVALRLLAPQRGLFATVRSKSKNKSKSLALLSSLPQHRQFEKEHTPGILKVLLPPRQSRGISIFVSKRYSHNLFWQASYTLAHSVDDASVDFPVESVNDPPESQNIFDRKGSRGRSDFDIRHNFVANAAYELPGSGRFLGGWQISAVVDVHSGPPFAPVLPFDKADLQGLLIPERPDLIGNPDAGVCPNRIKVGAPSCWFNPSAFAVPPAGQFGNAGRNMLRGPAFAQFDVTLHKDFAIVQEKKITVGAEAYNLFNHPNFGVPSNTQSALSLGGNGMPSSRMQRVIMPIT
ncbi:MAG: carboxypeptidase-like regulatory domain-containing protein [Terracidiphilus sp.]